METLKCKKCGADKCSDDFYFSNMLLKTGWKKYFHKTCKSCELEEIKNKNLPKREEMRKASREKYQKDPDKAREKSKKWREKNREKVLERDRRNYQKNKEKLQQIGRENYYKNRDTVLERKKKQREENRDAINEKQRSYQKGDNYKNTRNKWRREKRVDDSFYRFKENLRSRVSTFFKTGEKSKSTQKMLGCSYEFLKQYFESLFKEGMTWENHGVFGWHIDHIIPLSSANTTEEVEKLCHYTNLQPLWWQENLKKWNKMPD